MTTNANQALFLGGVALLIASTALGQAGPSIIALWIPPGSQDDTCWVTQENVYAVEAPPYPLSGLGIGHLVDPCMPSGPPFYGGWPLLTLHDHVPAPFPNTCPRIPDPARQVITYRFNQPTIVTSIDVVQHIHGIAGLEAFVGSSPSALTSIGAVYINTSPPSPSDPCPGGLPLFAAFSTSTFTFPNTTAAQYLRVVILYQNQDNPGFGTYRIYPRDASGVRIPPVVSPPNPPPGQANSQQASLTVNGVGTVGSPGPFAVSASSSGSVSFAFQGSPNMPFALYAGDSAPGFLVLSCIGSIDLAVVLCGGVLISPSVVFDGFQFPFFQTGPSGLVTITLPWPVGPSSPIFHVQGLVLQPAGAPCAFVLTAAFDIS
jgi:hypothetical protein